MRLPKKLKVKDQEYEIKRQWAPRVAGRVVDGYCDSANRVIVFAHGLKGKELERVFFHEVFHAICAEVGIYNTEMSKDIEEILADNLSNWLTVNFDFRRIKK